MKELAHLPLPAVDARETRLDLLESSRRVVIGYFSLATGAFAALLLVTGALRQEPAAVMLGYAGLLLLFGVSYWLRSRSPNVAGALCSLGPLVLVVHLTAQHGGLHSPSGMAAFVTLVALAGLLWSARGALLVAGLSSAAVAWFVHNAPPPLPMPAVQIWAELSFQFVLIALLAALALRVVASAAAARVAHREAVRLFEQRIEESQSIEALGRLAGGVAHDFNNLLTVILGTTQILDTSAKGSPEMRKDIRRIEEAAEKAALLTSQLLAVGRKQVLLPRVIDPAKTLETLVPLLRRLLPASVTLQLQTEPEAGNLRIDEARLEQALINLVTNANDALTDQGNITISLRRARARIVGTEEVHALEIAVADDGEGMTEAVQKRIFEPFFTTKPHGLGTGLGLAMVQGMVEQSGGRVEVESSQGHGSRFRLLFPEVVESPDDTDSCQRITAVASPRRLLLVEPMREVREATRRMLETLGHVVVDAESAEQAMGLLPTLEELDALLTAVILPDGPAERLVEEARVVFPGLPVLLISGNPIDGEPDERMLATNEHLVRKPLTQKLLHRHLCALLESDKPGHR